MNAKRKREPSISLAHLLAHHDSDVAPGSTSSQTSVPAFMPTVVDKTSCIASGTPH